MAVKPYMPFYTSEYMNDTAHLTMAEHGAYLLLIIHYWHTEKPLPDDDKKLAQICRTTLKGFRQIKLTVSLLFTQRGNTWVHKRIEKEIREYYEKVDAKRLGGQKTAEKRWGNKDSLANSLAIAKLQHSNMLSNRYTDTDTDTEETETEEEPVSVSVLSPAKEIPSGNKLKTVDTRDVLRRRAKKNRSALQVPPSDKPVFIFIPLRGEEEYGLTEEMAKEFERTYPDLLVREELQKIRAWSLSNSTKRKTRRGVLRFINWWLAKNNDQLSEGLRPKKLSAVEHNQLLLERRIAKYQNENLKKLPIGEEDNVSH